MAQKKLTLTTPETRSDFTVIRANTVTINFDAGEVQFHYLKENEGGTEMVTGLAEFIMPSADLKTIENMVLGEAATAETLPGGTITDAE